MKSLIIERPNYFTGEALLTDDFICEQAYQMGMLATHNTSLYTYGIATGLEVSQPATNNGVQQVQVSPGVAIDRLGRQIILLQGTTLSMENVQPSTTYFITINYHEVYSDFTDETGTPGYKRIVQQPQLKYLRNLDEPGINILLAAVSFDASSNINNLTYQSQNKQRRYVATSVGAVQFVTAGSGVNANADLAAASVLGSAGYAQILSKPDGTNSLSNYYLEFDAPRSQFMGDLTGRGNVGIGIDHPTANLQINAVVFKGPGTFTTNNARVTFDNAPTPFFQVGDVLVSDQSVGNGPSQTRTITNIVTDGSTVDVDTAFSPNLSGTTYTYIRSALARFATNSSASSLFQVNYDGSVGLGKVASTNNLVTGPNALTITSDRRVGIALSSGAPAATLDVNGNINTTGITSSGKIVAQSFEGNGSGLKNLNIISDWIKETPGSNVSNLYYNSGNVGILDANPVASLSVGGGNAIVGSGVISNINGTTVVGYNTVFVDQVKPGDILAIGTLNEQRATVVTQPTSDTSVTINSQFPIPVIDSAFSVLSAATGDITTGTGTITSNGTTVIGKNTTLTQLNAGDTLVIPRFTASAAVVQTCNVASVASDTSLTLAATTPFTGVVNNVAWQYVPNGSTTPVNGTGTISVAIDPQTNQNSLVVTGTGTNFETAFPNGGAGAKIIASPTVSGAPQSWRVASVQDQLTLTLEAIGNQTPQLNAATSAFMVTNGLLAKFQTNSDNGILDEATEALLPPAMLIVNNSDPTLPNTVGINVALAAIDKTYALQVEGAVSFSGGGSFNNLTVNTLLANQSVTVGNLTPPASNLLTIGGTGGTNNLLAVNATSGVSVSSVLSVQGTLNASGNISSSTQLVAPQVIGTTNVQTASAISNALTVTGLGIDTSGTVSLFGARSNWSLSSSNTTINSTQAASDGFVYGVISQTQMNGVYWGAITASSYSGGSNGNLECTMSASTTTLVYTTPDGKGSTTSYVAVPGTFTMPVRKGEFWTVVFQSGINGFQSPNAVIYWIPLGNGSSAPYTAPATTPAPTAQAATAVDKTTVPAAAVVQRQARELSAVQEASANTAATANVASSAVTTSPSVAELNQLVAKLVAIPNTVLSGTTSATQTASTLATTNLAAASTTTTPAASSATVTPAIHDEAHPAAATTGATTAATTNAGSSTPPATDNSLLTELHQGLQNMVAAIPGANGGLATTVQDIIDQRVGNLTKVLDSITHTGATDADKQQFIQELQKIVCSATPSGQVVAKLLDDQNIQSLIDLTSKLTGHAFTSPQVALLTMGIKALVEINENDANRSNLSLIKNNVDTFISNLEKSLETQFSTDDKRGLLRALVTLVGDGRARPDVATTPPITAPASGATTSGTTTPPANTGGTGESS